MANVTNDIPLGGIGQDSRRFHVPVNTGANIYAGTMVAQLANGLLVAATTSGSGPVIGKAVQTVLAATAGQRCMVETDRIYTIANGSSGDAFSDAFQIGAPVFAFDDHTGYNNNASGTLQQCGTFQGMEADGKIRVFIAPQENQSGALKVQAGRGTFAAGVLEVAAGITVTATSRVFASRVTAAGTPGDEIRVPAADRVPGGPGTGALTFRSFLTAVAATSDTSTFDWLIVG